MASAWGAASTIRRKTRDLIKKHGRSVIGVFGEGAMPFAYTIGNHARGMPEIVLVGLCDENAMGLLNLASEIQNRRGRPLGDGEVVSLGEGAKFAVKFIDASNTHTRDEYTIQAGQYWGRQDYAVRQLLMPDKLGRFPDDPACARPYSDQPLLVGHGGKIH